MSNKSLNAISLLRNKAYELGIPEHVILAYLNAWRRQNRNKDFKSALVLALHWSTAYDFLLYSIEWERSKDWTTVYKYRTQLFYNTLLGNKSWENTSNQGQSLENKHTII